MKTYPRPYRGEDPGPSCGIRFLFLIAIALLLGVLILGGGGGEESGILYFLVYVRYNSGYIHHEKEML